MSFFRFLFLSLIGGVSVHQLVIVNLMSVEVGAVNAGEFDLSADGDPASAAHTRAVNHDGVKAYDGLYAVGLCGKLNELQHGDGADGDYGVILVSGLDELFELVRYEAFFAV